MISNPFSGKWAILCWCANSNKGPDKLFGFVTRHDPIFSECNDEGPDGCGCWSEDHQVPRIWDSKEELLRDSIITNNSEYCNYTPIQIP